MTDFYGFPSLSAAKRVTDATKLVERLFGDLGPRGGQPPREPPSGIWVVNKNAQAAPPGALLAVVDVVFDENTGREVYVVDRPDTTLRICYLVNGPQEIPAKEFWFLPLDCDVNVAHDPDWEPEPGQSGGPKPGSWLLFQGYPGCVEILGVADGEIKLATGRLHRIESLLCRATDTIAGDEGTTNYVILAGEQGDEANAGFTTVPEAWHYMSEPLSNADTFFAKRINSGWAIIRPGGKGNRRFLGTLGAALASADSMATIALSVALDGGELPESVTSAQNTLSKSGQNEATVVVEEDLSTESATYHLMDVERVTATFVTDIRYDSSTHKWQKKTQKVTVLYEEAESEWTDLLTMTPYEVLDDVYWSSPFLQKSPVTIYLPEAPAEGSDETILNAVPAVVVEDVQDAGSALLQYVKTVLTFEDGDSSPDPIASIDDCEE